MNLQRINQLADDAGFTGYEGDMGNQYTGYGDDFLDFAGEHLDFASEIASDRIFTITLTNMTGAAMVAALNPSYSPTTGYSGGTITDGNIVTNFGAVAGANFTSAGAPKLIAALLAFVKDNPSRCLAFKVTSNSSTQLAQTVTIARKSPFRDLENEFINLATYTSEMNQNDKMVTVRRQHQWDNQTEILFPVPAGTIAAPVVTTITVIFGAVLNNSAALNKKAAKAGKNPQVANARAMVAGK